jgi:hypothetical protein
MMHVSRCCLDEPCISKEVIYQFVRVTKVQPLAQNLLPAGTNITQALELGR